MESEYFRRLVWMGLRNTVLIAVVGLCLGILIGGMIGVIKAAPKRRLAARVADRICSAYVALFRGTPMVVQLLLAYYVLLPALGVRGVEAVRVGMAVFGLNSGAYVSELMRSGLGSVDPGQMEAGRAVGLSYLAATRKIVLPQAFHNILPALGNEFVTLIKETSVLSFITVYDLYTAFGTIGAKNYEKMVPYLAMALIYILLVLAITLLVRLVEKLTGRGRRAHAAGL
ncbi:MAG: amino acid ABC transporter permease [Clostridia bacterium]|nr:amino acid ABC transporter permease [Clostridia bacterium]